MQFNQESIAEKAKEFISRHKGKLAAAAGLTLLGGGGLLTAGGLGYIGYLIGKEENNRTKNNTNSTQNIVVSNTQNTVANDIPKPVVNNKV